MFTIFMKTTIRNFLKNSGFSAINIIGLAVGLAASLMIAMWVFDELSYDRFHRNADRIFRVERDIVYKGQAYFVPVTGAIYGKTILEDYPEVENMVRIDVQTHSIEDKNLTRFNETVHYADASFFDVFSFPLKLGDPNTALVEPQSLVLSEETAAKFFGNENPLNQTLRIDRNGEMIPYKITGVLRKLPSNKHFQFSILGSFSTLEKVYSAEQLNTWLSNYLYTYLLLKPEAGKKQLETKLDGLVNDKIIPAYTEFLTSAGGNDASFRLFLRPITDIHLKAGLMWDIEVQGDLTAVYVFSIISLLILLIACFNFMSLSTALAGNRSLEVGIRKTVGSGRNLLMWQFIGESLFTSLISAVIALGLIQIFLPSFNNLTDKVLSLAVFGNFGNFLILLLIIVGTGFFSGIYPAFYLSAVKPITVLKGRMRDTSRNFSFRQVLVVLQFTISIALIIGAMTALRQMRYMQNKPLGYDKDNLLVLPVESNDIISHYESYKSDLLSNPVIKSVTVSQKVPAEREYSDTGWENDINDEVFLSRFFTVDFDFLKTYKLSMAAGRFFEKDQSTDRNFKVVINETAAKKLGYTNPEDALGDKYHADWIAKEIDSLSEGQIIGVVKDFHFQSLKNKIEPLALILAETWINRITVRYADGREKEAIEHVENTWKKHFPGVQFSYSFIHDYLTTFYKSEQKLEMILLVFTFLAIFIACLGLFGLAIFIAQQKVKEIGVRKALGASTWNIVYLLSASFTKWVLVANILAWPASWYFMNEWLSSFSYRIEMNVWTFLASGLLALVVSLFTVTYRSWLAARRNPVESLRYE